MAIKRHRRRLANGEEHTYIYEVNGSSRRSLGIVNSSVAPRLFRVEEKNRIVATLQADSSLLVIGEAGCGKSVLGSAVALELRALGFPVAIAHPATAKQTLSEIAEQFEIDTRSIEGKTLTTQGLMEAISEFLEENTAFLICDEAQRMQVQLRCWLEKLYDQEQPLLLLATFPPARDIFLKLPRIELKALPDIAIREIMREASLEMGLNLSTTQLAGLSIRYGGNPMLARRVVREEYLGLEESSPDHTQWVDITPFIVASLMCLVIIRFLGLGLNSTTLYLVGGILTVAVSVIRLLLYSLPRSKGRLGR
jgi:hypothetical protein